MDKQRIFETWVPRQSLWSDWAKPVLFAHLPRTLVEIPSLSLFDTSWVPPVQERWAIVVDLPNIESVSMGLALAELGYRPVPLFNACPPPVSAPNSSVAVINVDSILTALVQGCDRLRQFDLSANAPPAFLLDELRQTPQQAIRSGQFDNRSVVFTTDFPSATFLSNQQIQGAIVVRRQSDGMGLDLGYVLKSWQKGGVLLQTKDLSSPLSRQAIALPNTSIWSQICLKSRVLLSFHRGTEGNFGAFIAESSGG
jgi:hypothetical protein